MQFVSKNKTLFLKKESRGDKDKFQENDLKETYLTDMARLWRQQVKSFVT